jgi:hypothetical protein
LVKVVPYGLDAATSFVPYGLDAALSFLYALQDIRNNILMKGILRIKLAGELPIESGKFAAQFTDRH